MPSSISNSRCAALAHAKLLCVLCLTFALLLEGLSAYLLKHYSVTYGRVSKQFAQAAEARPSKPGQPASVVMVGNSLFLEGVQVDRLRDLTAGNLRIYPIFLEGTGYFDWLYALRRVFRQGARPQVVVVQLDANSFLWNQVRTEYAPRLFFEAPDLIRVGSDLGLDRTATSSLLLSHWSAFWGGHSVIRTQILHHIIPHFEDLFSVIPLQRNALRQNQRNVEFDAALEAIATDRLKTLRDLCNTYGARMVMLAPPTPSSEGAVRKLVAVSQRVGVAALVPIDPTALTLRAFERDALHLNSDGAALFTSAIARISGRLVVGQFEF